MVFTINMFNHKISTPNANEFMLEVFVKTFLIRSSDFKGKVLL